MGIIALRFITFYSNKPENPKAQKTFDITNPKRQASSDAICYIFEHLTSTEFL
jgi:hypothetical protein